MQKLLSIGNVGVKGLNTDVAPWDLPPEYLTFGKNFKVIAGSLQSSGGYSFLSSMGENLFPGFILPVNAINNDFWLVGCRNAIYAFNGSTWTDVSSIDGYSLSTDGELRWNGAILGSVPILNNRNHYPEIWQPQSLGQKMTSLPFSPTETWKDKNYRCNIIRSHKGFLFALGMNEDGIDFRDTYRWSNPADANSVPFTWDETDLSAIAGRASLGGDNGPILDGLSLRDAFCIYSEEGLDVLDFTGDAFVWRRRKLSSTIGLLSTNCVTEVKGAHFFIADGDIVRNDGNSIGSIIHNRLRKRIISNASTEFYKRSFTVRNNLLKEVWFCVPENGAEYPNIAYIYNWKDDSWVIRDLHDSLAHAAYGTQEETGETWDQSVSIWDTDVTKWNGNSTTPENNTIVSIDNSLSNANLLDPIEPLSGDYNTILERTDFPMEGHRGITTLTRVYPHISGSTPLLIEFGSQDFAGAPIRWQPSVPFIPGVDRKIDIRTTGALHTWRFSSLNNNTWSFSGMDIEYSDNGVR